MTDIPRFPDFKAIRLQDREVITERLQAYQPDTSDLTFTSLFIWRAHYRCWWCVEGDALLLLHSRRGSPPFALQPIGPSPRADIVRLLLAWLAREKGVEHPFIGVADGRLAEELAGMPEFVVEPVRDYFDYVYRTADLISLPGRKYHGKRNHISRFLDGNTFAYAAVDKGALAGCLEMADRWCHKRRCDEDMGLTEEREAVLESIRHFEALGLTGGMLLVNGRVEAFSFGELLNRETAVIHVEKANPDIPGLYPLINREFAREAWSATTYINREEDMGEEGLRRAKESYRPVRLVEKYRITVPGTKS